MDMKFSDQIEMYRRQYIGALQLGYRIPISPAGLAAEVAEEAVNGPALEGAPWNESAAMVKKLRSDFDWEYTEFYNTQVLEAPLPDNSLPTFIDWWKTTRVAALRALAPWQRKPAWKRRLDAGKQ
jgi:hypothetical protein